MDKKFISLVLVILIAGGGYFVFTNVLNNDTPSDSMMIEEEDAMMEESKANEAMMEEEATRMADETAMEKPETAFSYTISEESNAEYVAQKRFLNQDDVEVVGVTEDVTGEGWIDFETQNLYLKAMVDLSTLTTDTPTRDKDLQGRFDDTNATIVLVGIEDEVTLNTPFTTTATAEVTINGVTMEKDVTIDGTITEDDFTAEGSFTALVSDFGMEPPSLLNVYTVDDEIEVRFNVVGTRTLEE
ncbi:MAG: YceI family protein [Patescibacteria group bacterium]